VSGLIISTGKRDTEKYLYISATKNGRKKDMQVVHFNFYLNQDFVNCDYIEFMPLFLNIMSVAYFFEKNGFKLEGRHREARFWDGKFHDELVYGLLEHEYLEEHI